MINYCDSGDDDEEHSVHTTNSADRNSRTEERCVEYADTGRTPRIGGVLIPAPRDRPQPLSAVLFGLLSLHAVGQSSTIDARGTQSEEKMIDETRRDRQKKCFAMNDRRPPVNRV